MSGPLPGSYPEVGETFVQGKSQQTARELLQAAEALQLDVLVVRTAAAGFIVPNEVWDTAEVQRQADPGLAV